MELNKDQFYPFIFELDLNTERTVLILLFKRFKYESIPYYVKASEMNSIETIPFSQAVCQDSTESIQSFNEFVHELKINVCEYVTIGG